MRSRKSCYDIRELSYCPFSWQLVIVISGFLPLFVYEAVGGSEEIAENFTLSHLSGISLYIGDGIV